jgi:hypothetical protein
VEVVHENIRIREVVPEHLHEIDARVCVAGPKYRHSDHLGPGRDFSSHEGDILVDRDGKSSSTNMQPVPRRQWPMETVTA